MPRPEYTRRTVMLGAGASWGVGPLAALAGFAPDAVAEPDPSPTAEPFDSGHVIELAEALAAAEFVKPHREVAEAFAKLTAEQFRDIRYRSEQTLWRGENLDCELQLYPMGWIYDAPVDIWLVEGGKARVLKADAMRFTATTMTIQKSTGISNQPPSVQGVPRKLLREKSVNVSLVMEMVAPLVISRPMPRKAYMVASVMMNGGRPSCTIPKP